MIEAMTVIALYGGTFTFITCGVYFGTKVIDRMLFALPPVDPDKPVVRPISNGDGANG